jgi:FRG domain
MSMSLQNTRETLGYAWKDDMITSSAAPYVIDSLAGFIAAIVQYCPNHHWTFRGQAEDWDLLPKAYRDGFYLRAEGKNDDDLARFKRWRDQAIAFESNFPSGYLDQLALAQHYGLATRLMDWTANAAIALYFASEYQFAKDPINQDGAVYLYRKPGDAATPLEHVKSDEDLRKCDSVLFYRPRLVNRRILAQDGEFTIHPYRKLMEVRAFVAETSRSAAEGTVMKMSVPGSKKEDLQYQLRAIGIQARTAYPDLEGLAKSTNWQTNWLVNRSRIDG